MLKIFLLLVLLLSSLFSKYLTNESCNECHEKIYDEFQSSMHSKTYFSDELHRKIADTVSKKKYDCAPCHMPMADNLKDLIVGDARPDKNNRTHSDAISCYFCHTIAYVKKSHKYFENQKARQAGGFKPSLFGTLKNPDSTDKHSGVKSPIYTKNACKGCHSFKLNDYNVTIFRAMDDKQTSQDCVKCHMPHIKGGNEKMNKKARTSHVSHKFLGIRDVEFRKTGVDLNISIDSNTLKISIKNKMAHPLIIQAARAKYLMIKQIRNGKTIWQNFKKDPREDKNAYFGFSFTKNGKKVIIPATATKRIVNNLATKSEKILTYRLDDLKKGDKIEVILYGKLAKSDCASAIKLEDKSLLEPFVIKSVNQTL